MKPHTTILDDKHTKALLKFRTANHKFPIETGRYHNLPIVERKCPYCTNMVGDEFHFLLECPQFKRNRKKYIDTKYHIRPNMYKYNSLMQNRDTGTLCNLGKFVNILIKSVNTM